jgi:hypothetical protein
MSSDRGEWTELYSAVVLWLKTVFEWSVAADGLQIDFGTI